jgi:hypothetical protein
VRNTQAGEQCRAPASPTRLSYFAVSLPISGRLGWTQPAIARFLTGAAPDVLDSPSGLAPRALRDIRAEQQAGFTALDADVALSAVAGGLLGLLRLCQDCPERMNDKVVDQLADAVLRQLGCPRTRQPASPLCRSPTPATGSRAPRRPDCSPGPRDRRRAAAASRQALLASAARRVPASDASLGSHAPGFGRLP